MRYALTVIGLLAALTMIVASCGMNFVFWSQQGRSVEEGYILGSVSVAVDVLKAILPVLIGIAIAMRRWIYVALGSVVFTVFVAAALVSAIGFISLNRGDIVGGRASLNAQLELAQTELDTIQQDLSRLSGYPPIATLEANLHALAQNRRFSATRECTDATVTASRQFCEEYFEAKAKLGSAIEANRLTSKRDQLSQEVRRLRQAGAGREADPQAGLFARWIPGLDVSTARDGLMLFFALLVELGAAFGLFLATRHSFGNARKGDNSKKEVQGYPVILQNLERSPLPAIRRSAEVIPMRKVAPERFVLDETTLAWAEGRDMIEANRITSKG